MLCNKKKKKDNPTLTGTKDDAPHFSCKIWGNFCTLDSSKTTQNPYKIEIWTKIYNKNNDVYVNPLHFISTYKPTHLFG
jgi:hypothetical protein